MSGINGVVENMRSARRTLYILCGYPYAGKTYVARRILKETVAALVNIDELFHARGFDWNTNKLPSAGEWQEIFDESYVLTREALERGENVLFDSTNQTVASRDKLREVATSAGAGSYVIFIKTDEATVWKRREESARQKSRSVISKKLVEDTMRSFEAPIEEEHLLIIYN